MKKRLSSLVICICIGFILIGSTIDLNNLFNYENQYIPVYITKDNTSSNAITDEVATLGRVLFYDKRLSSNNTVSCASCHIQEKGFGDDSALSPGWNGELTGRHTPRLINVRFGNEKKFFWDERAANLEEQVTMPIKNHIEMGFSGTNGDPDIEDMCDILADQDYYTQLFKFAFGDEEITEERIQSALAQFVRSIQSFDSKFDVGLAQVSNINDDFPNFTEEENLGKEVYLKVPVKGGAGCNTCHVAPEFDIHPLSLNNGVIGVAGNPAEIDITNTRSPSMRDLVNPDGTLNGPMMHDGSMLTLMEMIDHYDAVPNNPLNTNLDDFFKDENGIPQNLNLSIEKKNALIAFLKTLTGSDVYVNEKWSDPFDNNGNLTVLGGTLSNSNEAFQKEVAIYPVPANEFININIESGAYDLTIYNLTGNLVLQRSLERTAQIDVKGLKSAIYVLKLYDRDSQKTFTKKIIKS